MSLMKNVIYDNLDKQFTTPKTISPFYKDDIKISRKLKKKVKLFCGVHWNKLSNSQRLWYYMDSVNPNYKSFLIKNICK